ncbi:cyanophycin metabolism-associated DUF1854 family protein [Cognatazoarcus halotolerans]|uniref:cyanophycin metabolism-associated DUF1854 family protein n=1 Tax=Cognatazoarcus halotolerans TaxID=2686016 RepID=UPI0013598458|nr:DUF1854 domain-containing protein [Cognatazoarcus halotolerans]MCB1897950.1 DUF1854 domain-containing protein [Rhodocyclaceae bacterium]MCP5309645.1 DUF1854 domain-containing protein [Zoogloeaceae bacterium]
MASHEEREIGGLERDAHGRLVLTLADGSTHTGIVPIRAFPLGAPREGVALVGATGREICWIECLDELPEDVLLLVEEELASRDFMPRIRRLVEVSTFSTPSVWRIETDRGSTSLVLKAEEDIRRLDASRLVITDRHGVHYMIENQKALDQASRKLLDRFL